jgi:aryl-alcohol dehydrogenase-like predicted oxidoreductase
MGRALQDGYRYKAFLMTKIDGRDKKTAAGQIDESLKRLRTDVIDLLQFHEIIQKSDPDRIFAPGGAMEALLEARDAGKTRYIGFTGHKSPDLILRMLELASRNGVRFDAVQMPLNIMDAHFDSFQHKVLPGLVEQNIGVVAMKPIGNRIILDSRTVSAPECLRYAMSLPVSVVITGCDTMPILKQAVTAGRGFTPMSGSEKAELLARTAVAGSRGEFELYKTNDIYDATRRNPQWLDASLKTA